MALIAPYLVVPALFLLGGIGITVYQLRFYNRKKFQIANRPSCNACRMKAQCPGYCTAWSEGMVWGVASLFYLAAIVIGYFTLTSIPH
jgi:TM2 domain-containing membrane protein YozV